MNKNRELKKLQDQVAAFEKLVVDFPLCETFKDILAHLHAKRVELVSAIGKK